MNLYQRIEVDEVTPVQFCAVHPLRWRPEWGEPKALFKEAEVADLLQVPEVTALVEACGEFIDWYHTRHRIQYAEDAFRTRFVVMEMARDSFKE